MYILPPSISKKIEGYRWQRFTPPAAGKSRRFRGLICHRRSQRRLIGFDAVKHLLLARIEKRPAHLDLSRYPHLPQPFVAATRSADYATLPAGEAVHG